MTGRGVVARLDGHRSTHRWLVRWCVRRARRTIDRGQAEEGARWLTVAGELASTFGCGALASPELELCARRLARGLDGRDRGEVREPPSPPLRWLHVMSVAPPVGGHTALVRRWLENDDSGDTHSLALTWMSSLDLPPLVRAVHLRGGRVSCLGGTASLLDRARALREAAWQGADRVVLHVHNWDVVPTVAFGVEGGPPVLLVNHSDHLFWVGGSVADLVLSIRESGADVSASHRGIDRNAILPVPLPAPAELPRCPARRIEVRGRHGIPESALVFLTIGSEFKYRPVGRLDFPAAMRRLLSELSEACLIAVGPDAASPGWAELIRDFGRRVSAVGERLDLPAYHAAADVYLESFPFGSITALLEAGIDGLPFVRLPATAPPPFSSERFELTALAQPADVPAYLGRAIDLARSSDLRARTARSQQAAILAYQGGDAWRARLEAVKRHIPSAHHTYALSVPPLPAELDRFWTEFLLVREPPDPLTLLARRAEHHRLKVGVAPGLLRPALTLAVARGPAALWAWGGLCWGESWDRHIGWRLRREQRREHGGPSVL